MNFRAGASLGLFLWILSCSDSGFPPEAILVDARGGSGRGTIPAATTERRYFVLPFSSNEEAKTDQAAFHLTLDVSTSTAAATKRAALSHDVPAPWAEMLYNQIRSEEYRHRIDPDSLKRAATRVLRSTAPATASAPSLLTIYSPFSGEENEPITGTRRSVSTNAALYIDSRDNALVTDGQVTSMMDAYDKISLPRLHAIFGEESDVDGNGVVILFLASAQRIGPKELGFFRPSDLLPDGSVSGVKSNRAEIVYSRIPDGTTPGSLVNATLAHETFHMINFAQKTLGLFQGSGGSVLTTESLFLNEGLAHLAEDLTGWSDCTALMTKIYLDCLPYTSLAGPGTASVPGNLSCGIAAAGDDSLPRRGGMMLFLLYLFQQMGGATYSSSDAGDISGPGLKFLKNLNTSPLTGIQNIEGASGRSFFDSYAGFVAAMAMDATGLTTDSRLNFQPEVLDPFTNMKRNIRMRTSRIDVDGSTIELNGPVSSEDFSAAAGVNVAGSVFRSGMAVLKMTVPAHTTAQVTIEGSPDFGIGLTLVPAP